MCTKINETTKTKFEELMNSCIDVTDHSEASLFVAEVEDFITKNGINTKSGGKFYFYYVMQEYESYEGIVKNFINEHEHDLDEGCTLPKLGFKWLPCSNRLVLGVYDGIGDFEEWLAWEFDI
jgi:hypothetical protein